MLVRSNFAIRRFSSKAYDISPPKRISEHELSQVKSLPEFKSFEEAFASLNLDVAEKNLHGAINILNQVGQDKSYASLFLMKNLVRVFLLQRDFDQSEKVLLMANQLSRELNGGNEQNKFINQMDLATLYMYKDIEMAVDFCEAEIS